ncbi:GNAT family N-acetyltransferase [Pseudonocardia sp. GCM10023141]|uniref:GNAT family N-acetyltransferase n=1 Tax=Pseudonocardia sp. GCM10023141 TaxID=3252653 RepID=UPI0036243966
MIEIRGARPDDDAALVAIDEATWSEATTPAPRQTGPWAFLDRFPLENVLVGTIDGVVAGYALVSNPLPVPSHAHVLQLNGLAVGPGFTGHGLGRALVEAAVATATERGARKITLRVLGSNAVARHLYASCGFVEEGVLQEEFLLGGAYVDDVFMARRLVPAGSSSA